MRTGARLPAYLWVELCRAVVYLYNRTPKYMYNWRTPYDRCHTYLAQRDEIVVEDRTPSFVIILSWHAIVKKVHSLRHSKDCSELR